MKKIVCLPLIICIILSFSGCTGAKNKLKIGVVLSSDSSDAYIKKHIDGIEYAAEYFNIKSSQLLIKENVAEDDCLEIINELNSEGCNIIFGAGNNPEDYFVQAATENPKVDYCFADGNQATNGLDNYHNYSFAEYQTRYISGVVAGTKLNDMFDNGETSEKELQIGYIAEFPDSDNISAYTAFYLGAKSVCDKVKMKVQYTYSDRDEDSEKKAALALIANSCKLITQQSYLNGSMQTCEDNGIYFIGLFGNDNQKLSEHIITFGQMDISGCYVYAIESILNSSKLPSQWSKSCFDKDFSFVSELNESSFTSKEQYEFAEKKVAESEKDLIESSIKVFDIKKWSVNGKTVNTTQSEEYEELYHGIEYIDEKGYFKENELSSNPVFEFKIDGILELNYMEEYFGLNIGGQSYE